MASGRSIIRVFYNLRKRKLERHRAGSFSALRASPLIENNLQLYNALETALRCKLALQSCPASQNVQQEGCEIEVPRQQRRRQRRWRRVASRVNRKNEAINPSVG